MQNAWGVGNAWKSVKSIGKALKPIKEGVVVWIPEKLSEVRMGGAEAREKLVEER